MHQKIDLSIYKLLLTQGVKQSDIIGLSCSPFPRILQIHETLHATHLANTGTLSRKYRHTISQIQAHNLANTKTMRRQSTYYTPMLYLSHTLPCQCQLHRKSVGSCTCTWVSESYLVDATEGNCLPFICHLHCTCTLAIPCQSPRRSVGWD